MSTIKISYIKYNHDFQLHSHILTNINKLNEPNLLTLLTIISDLLKIFLKLSTGIPLYHFSRAFISLKFHKNDCFWLLKSGTDNKGINFKYLKLNNTFSKFESCQFALTSDLHSLQLYYEALLLSTYTISKHINIYNNITLFYIKHFNIFFYRKYWLKRNYYKKRPTFNIWLMGLRL